MLERKGHSFKIKMLFVFNFNFFFGKPLDTKMNVFKEIQLITLGSRSQSRSSNFA